MRLQEEETFGGIWVYKYFESHIEKAFKKFPSMLLASKNTGRDRGTIRRFMDTNIPIRGLLFYSSPIVDLDRAFLLAKGSLNELKIDPSLSKKVWVYTIVNGDVILVNSKPFPSVGETARFLDTSYYRVKVHMDNPKDKQGLKGYYIFYKPLDSSQLSSLLQLPSLLINPRKYPERIQGAKVWAYYADTMQLINNAPFLSRVLAAIYFNVTSPTIANNLDSEHPKLLKKGTNGKSAVVYFFSKEISKEFMFKLKNNTNNINNIFNTRSKAARTPKIWVYQKIRSEGKDQFSLLDKFYTNRQAIKARFAQKCIIQHLINI